MQSQCMNSAPARSCARGAVFAAPCDAALTRRRARRGRTRCSAAQGAAKGAASAAGVECSSWQDLKWHNVDAPVLWQGSADTVLSPGSPVAELSSPWRMLLLSDGSVTRHLELITGGETTVECVQMRELQEPDLEEAAVPPAALRIPSPLLQRQSLLCSSAVGPPLVYAASWWCARTVDRYLADARVPIWKSLSLGQVEVYREILEVYQGHSPKLEELLQCEGPFWARNYFFYHSGRPLTLIHEVFSNRLEDSLGPRYERRRTQGGPPAGAAGPPKGASAAAAQQQHKQQQE